MSDSFEGMAFFAVHSPVGLVAGALTEVEAAILERDAAVRFGRTAELPRLERRAASTACVVLDNAIESLDGELLSLEDAIGGPGLTEGLRQAYTEASRAAAAGREMPDGSPSQPFGDMAPFPLVESRLLQLAGLAEVLAERHVRGALAAFRREDWTYDLSNHSYHDAVMQRLERGRDAVCAYAEQLEREDEVASRAQASRKRMRRVAQVLGGVLITGTNAAASLMLGPLAAAASTVIGAAATSVVDIAVETDGS